MLAEFALAEDQNEVVGRAVWNGRTVEVDLDMGTEDVRTAIERIFRPSPVLVDDPSLRSSGPELHPPGTLRWFIAAAESRVQGEGLTVRLTPQTQGTLGWDPAGAYRTFPDAMERRELHT